MIASLRCCKCLNYPTYRYIIRPTTKATSIIIGSGRLLLLAPEVPELPELPDAPPKGLAPPPDDFVAEAELPDAELELEPELVAVVIVVDGFVEPDDVLVPEAPKDVATAAEDADSDAVGDGEELGATVPSMLPKPGRGQQRHQTNGALQRYIPIRSLSKSNTE